MPVGSEETIYRRVAALLGLEDTDVDDFIRIMSIRAEYNYLVEVEQFSDAEAPLFADDLAEWSDRVEFEMFDGIEIAPHLPSAAGPPLLILDEASRIVDLTTSAAAVLGLPAADLVGYLAGRSAVVGAGSTRAPRPDDLDDVVDHPNSAGRRVQHARDRPTGT